MVGQEEKSQQSEITEISEKALKNGRMLFSRECKFVTGAVNLGGLPETSLPEIAFAGRSNVGKSSLINSLTGRKNIARTSVTPGRTREINFFCLNNTMMIADLPGFGYAKAPKVNIKKWTTLVENYLKGRASLRRTCLLIDSRRGPMQSDISVMNMLDDAAVSYIVVLTKSDKIKPNSVLNMKKVCENDLKSRPAAYPSVIASSSKTGDGISYLRSHLAALAVSTKSI